MEVEDEEDYQLRWPREVFQTEVARLLNDRDEVDHWGERCELLLEDAFSSSAPAVQFSALVVASRGARADPWGGSLNAALTTPQRWLADLLKRAGSLPYQGTRKLYFSERFSAGAGNAISIKTAVHEFRRLVDGLIARGYLEQAFGKDCVDDPTDISATDVIMAQLPREGLWPINQARLSDDPESFCDLIEVVHDLVAAPRYRWLHDYGGCGAHYGDFSISLGRSVYRWSVNRILERTTLELRLAEEGEDRGRLVATTDSARSSLVVTMADPDQDTTDGEVPHAIALFRSRGATAHDKRSACVALAGVLERRRPFIKEHLLSKDEGALFAIANQFGIRHQSADQRSDYDPAFLDWVFWFYLGAIELTDRLIERERTGVGKLGGSVASLGDQTVPGV